ncbi:hypothetical protein AM506_20685 [Rossellomorea vietnamensis]|uniref:Uncharacterized protein n=1 Tax=Rossellomorea vietnamensis TaxID=218284 RepID=A0A0P6VY04_9BACI|nr:hypothetical protein AM506_20685 [Rossellomorea vietnamensis]
MLYPLIIRVNANTIFDKQIPPCSAITIVQVPSKPLLENGSFRFNSNMAKENQGLLHYVVKYTY